MDEVTKAELYVQNKGWNYRKSGNQLNIELCPLCHKDNFHFFMRFGGSEDGLWDCKVCGERGNLYQLASKLGDRIGDLMSVKDWANKGKPIDAIPDLDAMHEKLQANDDAMQYLFGRGFTPDVIIKQKLGLESRDGKDWLVIPYFSKGTPVYVKYRTLPPAEKDFRSSAGREAPLYNQDCLTPNMEELFFVEGEPDCISLLSNGVTNVVGVPGANASKTLWVERIDNLKPKKIYLLYDNDQVGQKGAHEMALKLGIDKCYNILLPESLEPFKKVKDINEWFMAGHTMEEFQTLKDQARPFDVAGVQGMGSALDELEQELESKGGAAVSTFISPWKDLNQRMGGAEPGDLVGVMAEGKVGKTTMLLNWLDFYAKNGIPALLYCQEMPTKRLARKWASYVTETDDNPYTSKLTAATVRDAKAIAQAYPADLLLGFTRGHKPDHVFDVIRNAVRRYGIRVVGFDNLQLLSRSITNQQSELNVLGKKFKELAMELNILVILIVQPNRVREGEIVAARNAAGSSAIEKDVDTMICLHRNRVAKVKESDLKGYIETDETFEPQLYGNVDLSRYASGGKFTLIIDGEVSRVRDFDKEEFPMPVGVVGGAVPTEGEVIV